MLSTSCCKPWKISVKILENLDFSISAALRNCPKNQRNSPENSIFRAGTVFRISQFEKRTPGVCELCLYACLNNNIFSRDDPKVVCREQKQRRNWNRFHGYWLTSFNTIKMTKYPESNKNRDPQNEDLSTNLFCRRRFRRKQNNFNITLLGRNWLIAAVHQEVGQRFGPFSTTHARQFWTRGCQNLTEAAKRSVCNIWLHETTLKMICASEAATAFNALLIWQFLFPFINPSKSI